jgi:hypothetical protein
VFAMCWFRSNSLTVASLALFALACQFALSFGHVHLDRFADNSGNWTIAGGKAAAPSGRVKSADLPTAPRQKDQSNLGDGFCAICATNSLAGTVLLSAAPILLPRISLPKELRWSLASTRAPSIDHIHFNARGPPAA